MPAMNTTNFIKLVVRLLPWRTYHLSLSISPSTLVKIAYKLAVTNLANNYTMGLTGHGTIVDVVLIIAILIIIVVVIKWLIVPLIYGETLDFITTAQIVAEGIRPNAMRV